MSIFILIFERTLAAGAWTWMPSQDLQTRREKKMSIDSFLCVSSDRRRRLQRLGFPWCHRHLHSDRRRRAPRWQVESLEIRELFPGRTCLRREDFAWWVRSDHTTMICHTGLFSRGSWTIALSAVWSARKEKKEGNFLRRAISAVILTRGKLSAKLRREVSYPRFSKYFLYPCGIYRSITYADEAGTI